MYQGFGHTKYLMRREVLVIVGKWSIYDPFGNEVFYCEQEWSLITNIHIYTNKNKQEEVLTAKTRQIIDFSAAYDILDSKTNEKIGAVKRKGWESLLRDEWIIMDRNDREIGFLKEDNIFLALLRRFKLGWLLPKKYVVYIGEVPVAVFRKHFNPLVWKTSLDFSQDIRKLLDRRAGIALALLTCAIGERTR